MTVWFDVEDLFQYAQHGPRRVSGIQRVAFEVYRAASAIGGERVRFVRHAPDQAQFTPVDWPTVAAQLASADASQPSGERPPAARRAITALAGRLPEEIRKPLVLASVMQLQSAVSLGRFGVNLALHSARLARRPARPAASPTRFEPRSGDTMLVLGAPWFRGDFPDVVRVLRDDLRMRFGVLVYDLVPIRRPEWVSPDTRHRFEDWYAHLLPFCDLILAISRDTASDVEAYMEELRIAPRPVQVLPMGSGFGAQAGQASPPPGDYVLFVSTLEPRKNHALAVKVWSVLVEQVRAGTRDPASVPDLVFAGRVGWLVGDLLQQLDNTDWLGGKIRLLPELSDRELRSLYEGALFTLFPSLHEGWGLPVTESLALGKPCLCSNAGAVPEAGGALCRYFDPEDLGAAVAAVASVIDDRPALAAWEAEVRRSFRPTPWTETAASLLAAVARVAEAE